MSARLAVYRPEELNVGGLGAFLTGRQVSDYLSRDCFEATARYEQQRPSIYPFGALRYVGPKGIGYLERWQSEDKNFDVIIDRDGLVDSIERVE